MRNKRINTALENSWTKRADVIHNRVLQYFGISTSNTVTGRIDREIFVGEEKTLNDRQTP